ncbi:MAG: hypothetical protein ACP5RI_00280 [Candidatus Micrarchaeia archaeon]
MKNIFYKKFFIILFIISLSTLFSFAEAQVNSIPCTLLNIYNIVLSAIFLVGLTLMLLGGTLYAAAHIMPGQSKGTIQGYGMGMILGGVIGVILAIMLPYIFTVITGYNTQTFTANTQYCHSS